MCDQIIATEYSKDLCHLSKKNILNISKKRAAKSSHPFELHTSFLCHYYYLLDMWYN